MLALEEALQTSKIVKIVQTLLANGYPEDGLLQRYPEEDLPDDVVDALKMPGKPRAVVERDLHDRLPNPIRNLVMKGAGFK